MKKQIKGIKYLQDRSSQIQDAHDDISSDIDEIKRLLGGFDTEDIQQSNTYKKVKNSYIQEYDKKATKKVPSSTSIQSILAEADKRYSNDVSIQDILTNDDHLKVKSNINEQIENFNKKYDLDTWDYAIAVSCGLFAAMLDILCIKKPLKPTVAFTKKVDGIFNEWTQSAFNTLIPPDLSNALSKRFGIGGADSSTTDDLINAEAKTLSPFNHRLKSLSHDPLLGFFFGVYDLINNTCTVVSNGKLTTFATSKKSAITGDESIFQLLGQMFGHLLSDINAPSAKGNRGMGLPAPFMGLLTMLKNISFDNSTFATQIEYMYLKGYDFRQFITTSIPMSIMEVLLRIFYTIKQVSINNAEFGNTIIDTMPRKIIPRFRIMLATAYGTSSAVNAGKIYITKDILNANYTSWIGFAYNSFFSLKWILYDRQAKLWDGIKEKELQEIIELVDSLDILAKRASLLPS
ncbi:MAG: hypothetical protein ACRC5H_07265 [Treponemataceae bacterium]